MSLIQLKPNTPIHLNNEYGQILFADNSVILLGFKSGKTKTLKPKDFQELLKIGKLKVVRRKTELVIQAFSSDTEANKFHFAKECMDKMDHHHTPTARDNVKQIMLKAAERHGWPNGKKISDSTVIAWYSNWKKANRSYNSMFVSSNGKALEPIDKSALRYTLAEEVFYEVYLKLNGPTETDAYRIYHNRFLAKQKEFLNQNGEEAVLKLGKVMSKSSFNNFIRSFDAYEVMKARKGIKAARRYFRSRGCDNETHFPLERVEFDALHLQVGLKVIDDSGKEQIYKPIIYIAFDVYTRYVVGYHISVSSKASETANGVVQLIKHMMNPFKEAKYTKNQWLLSGAPENIFCDLGPAFTSHWVTSILASLNVNLQKCQAASPWKKPFVERFNGTIKVQFGQQIPGCIANRIRGEVMDGTIESLAVLTKEEFIQEFERYILDYYHQNPHTSLGNKSPSEFYEEVKHICPAACPESSSKLEAYAGTDRELNLTETGIQLNSLRYYSKELSELRYYLMANFPPKGNHPKVTVLVNNDDLSKIGVWDESAKEVLIVYCTDPTITEDTYLYEHNAKRRPRNITDVRPFECSISPDKSAENKNSRSVNKKTDDRPLHQLSDQLTTSDLNSLVDSGNGLVKVNYSDYKQNGESNIEIVDFFDDSESDDFDDFEQI